MGGSREHKSARRGDDPMDAYLRRLDRFGMLTREGELELARRRDRGWAVARGIALASADAGAVLDNLLASYAEHLRTSVSDTAERASSSSSGAGERSTLAVETRSTQGTGLARAWPRISYGPRSTRSPSTCKAGGA